MAADESTIFFSNKGIIIFLVYRFMPHSYVDKDVYIGGARIDQKGRKEKKARKNKAAISPC